MRYLVIMIIVLSSSSICAQSLGVSGFVTGETSEELPGATVILKSSNDSTLVKATVSEMSGAFFLKGLPSGNYFLEITSIGFQPYVSEQFDLISDKDFGSIQMLVSTEELDEVSIVAEKPMIQVLADKTVFNVENTVNATGTNAWELLRKAPGLIIDNNGSIILEGKAGVQIYIDDKPSQLRGDDLQAFLESLQSTDVESVEIITQPSSKYDAAGNAGILNILLKKDKTLGTNGSITAGFTYGEYARWNSSITFNNRTKTGNLFGTYSNGFGNYFNFLNLLRRQNKTEFNARTETVYNYNNNNIRLGYDLFVSAKSTVGILLNGNLSNNHFNSDSRTPIQPLGATQYDSVLVANNRSSTDASNYNLNLNYRFKDTQGNTLNLDADYGNYKRDSDTYQPNIYFNGSETETLSRNVTRQITPVDIHIATFKADYEQNLWKGILGAGFKVSYVNTDNDFDFYNLVGEDFILNINQSNRFEYTENINAGYINFNRKWDGWNLQLGLRVENTISDGDLTSSRNNINEKVKRNYTNWFPSGGLTYQLNEKNQFAFNYSRRIERPNYSSLNPFVSKIDELSYRRGNPFLQPQYTDNFKISHTYNYRLTTSLSYSFISDFFAQITESEGQNQNFISTQNIANQRVINLGISYPKKINDWWNVYLSVNAYRSEYEATRPEFVPITQETLSLYAQNTLNLPAEISMEVSGWYSSPSVWAGTYNTDGLGSLNLAFQKKFLNDSFNARIAFNDILYTSPWNGTTQFGDLYINGSGGSDSRNFTFSLTYNFGSNEVKKARNRETGIDDEKSRIQN